MTELKPVSCRSEIKHSRSDKFCLLNCCCNYRAWQAELQLEHHYRDRVNTRELDWTLKLGQQRLDMLTRQFGHRRVFISLSGMSCGICGRHTRGFSWLVCSRICKKYYKESPLATVYSVADALV
jgi:hypothetical protein